MSSRSTSSSTSSTPSSSSSSSSSVDREESRNEPTYTPEEVAFFESMVRVMRWAEQRTKDILDKMIESSASGPVDPYQQALDIFTQYYAADANGNEFPTADFLNVCTNSPFK